MKKNFMLAAILAFGALVSSCSKSDDNNNQPSSGNASVSMRLTDGPGNYEHVYLDVKEVRVTMEGSSDVVLVPARPGIYDIMKFRNGADTLLVAATPIPSGKISQIRLVLGDNNTVVDSGVEYPLTTPSGQTSGIKLNLNETLTAGTAYTVWLDFDAGKSVHQTGNGKYMLKPVIRAYTATTNGRIKGTVLPLGSFSTVYAINGPDTFAAIPAVDGFFAINGLPQATYSVWVDPGVTTLQDFMLNNVNVTFGTETDLGTITLQP